MAGTIVISNITTDTDNTFIVRSNTGAALLTVNATGIDVANNIPAGSITSAMIADGTVIAADIASSSVTPIKIQANTAGTVLTTDGSAVLWKAQSALSIANTQITGLVTAAQIATVANTQVTGTMTVAQGGTGVTTSTGTGAVVLGTSPTITGASITVAATAAPTFYAQRITTNQSISASTWTKVQCQQEDWDTNSNYDNATNYRFTPTVAGYYQFSGGIEFNNITGFYQIAFYKNGSSLRLGGWYANSTNGSQVTISDLIYCNGSSDYVELYGATSTAGNAFYTGGTTRFGGVFVRSA